MYFPKTEDAKNITGIQSPTGSRNILANILPLDTPLVVEIFSIYACNLSCKFCHYGLEKEKRPLISTKKVMDPGLYKKCILDLASFKHKIKLLRFCSTGEPLLDKNIIDMVDYAAKNHVAEEIEIITNGLLLTPELSQKLIDAGVTRLRVSIYGVNSDMYQEMCGKKINFNQLVGYVRSFFDLKTKSGKKIILYVKTMDCTLKDEQEKEQFIEIFKDICDNYAVEQVIPQIPGIDYSPWIEKDRPNTNTMGFILPSINVCPQPFYLFSINPDGMVIPCCASYNRPIGNANRESLYEIWHGSVLRRFQRTMLDGVARAGDICAKCNIGQNRPFPEDILDNDTERLKMLYSLCGRKNGR
jgi:MoaA/NifB/PqqE/SkfB family radical SAM enzyme